MLVTKNTCGRASQWLTVTIPAWVLPAAPSSTFMFYPNPDHKTWVVKMGQPFVCQLFLLGCIALNLTAALYLGEPTTLLCRARPCVFHTAITFAIRWVESPCTMGKGDNASGTQSAGEYSLSFTAGQNVSPYGPCPSLCTRAGADHVEFSPIRNALHEWSGGKFFFRRGCRKAVYAPVLCIRIIEGVTMFRPTEALKLKSGLHGMAFPVLGLGGGW